MVPIPAAIMKAKGHADIKTTVIYVSLKVIHPLSKSCASPSRVKVVAFTLRNPDNQYLGPGEGAQGQ